KDDILQSIDGVEIMNIDQFSQLIMDRPNTEIDLLIKRNEEDYITKVSLSVREDNEAMGYIGLQTTLDQDQLQKYMAIEKYSYTQSFLMSIQETNRMIGLTLNMLGKMVTGQISSDNLSGPVGIAKDAGTVAKRGIIATLSFMAIISISLGILNLLPIPVLDGGQILFICIETVIRRPLHEKIQMAFQQIGVMALLFLMGFALYNDLSRIFG
ncbi:MAG TPA: RIP metalloprotease RseP, partial [Gammaproteobacteria bacterium]|nr:RIP metalloprotease RseP [Gammaproteobacteria bacterium]